MMITSVNNPQIKALQKLHLKKYRDQSRQFLIEGEHLISEAIMANRLEHLYVCEGYEGAIHFDKTTIITDVIASRLSQTQSKNEIFGVCSYDTDVKLDGHRYLLCDDIQDPGNLGTMIRSAHSFGFDGVIVSETSVDFYNEKVIRATQGALFHIQCVRGSLIHIVKELKSKGIKVLATDVHKAKALSTFDSSDVALIVGHEGQGVSPALIALADERVKIETSAFESLNVGIASGILLYHFRKR